jgi:serine/threonine-protein kinase HipA
LAPVSSTSSPLLAAKLRRHLLPPDFYGFMPPATPAYDLVPTPVISRERRDLALTVGHYGRTASIYNLLSQAGRFGLSEEEARAEINRMIEVLRNWREIFYTCGVSAKDADTIAPALLPDCFFLEKRPEE